MSSSEKNTKQKNTKKKERKKEKFGRARQELHS